MSVAPARHESGQAMAEYLIILPALLLLILGSIQFALLYQVKGTLDYAVFMAARQGAVKNASKTAMRDALGAAMTPLFTFSPDVGGLVRGRLIGELEAMSPFITRIEILNPTDQALADFGVAIPQTKKNDEAADTQTQGGASTLDANADEAPEDADKEIPNDNLMYRSVDAGANSGMNVQDANILKIRVTYCAKLIVPLVNRVIYGLVHQVVPAVSEYASFLQPIVSDIDETAATSKLPASTGSGSDFCARFGDKVASNTMVSDAMAQLQSHGVDTTRLDWLLDFQSQLANFGIAAADWTIPGLDWKLGGLRIPITAEAVVRMQSPARL